MGELIEKLGIDWKLLLAQAVNFLLILFILRLTVYKPLLKILRQRREKIESGLRSAEMAEKRLQEIEQVKAQKIAEGEQKSVKIIEQAEARAKEKEAALLTEAHRKEQEVLQSANRLAQERSREAEALVYKEAAQLVRSAIERVVEKKPEPFDETLVAQALQELKKNA